MTAPGPVAVPGPPEPVTLTATAPLRHLCPFKDEVDEGTVTSGWSTCGSTLELHSLAAYLTSWAEQTISHEELTDAIRRDLESVPGIYAPTVETRWTTAGMGVTCSTSQTPARPRP